jgi:L-aspartate oxidase
MKRHLEFKRYLVSFDSHNLPHVFTDVLVIGSGAAGLSAALQAAEFGSVFIVTKDKVDENNTHYAQGGVAVVLDSTDSLDAHIKDTLAAGQGLCEPEVVEEVIKKGPQRIKELISWGAKFDGRNGELVFTQEGGHNHARIIHAKGDSTGMEIEATLVRLIKKNRKITLLENTFVVDLLVKDGGCKGAIVWDNLRGNMLIWAKQIILASGGCGQVYRETTNPEVSTGDGLAMAYRAGAEVQGLEFVQFHPTTLYIAGASRVLISETLRGEGGILRNKHGEGFMKKYHPKAELASRDVVSRSILQEMRATDHTHVYLDVTHIPKDVLDERFPKIMDLCASFDINISEDLIPVRPSAHYMIGGVKVNEKAQTNLQGLYACGEVACTGLHGANRLGSNSLLECLVYGHKAGVEAGKELSNMKGDLFPCYIQTIIRKPEKIELDLEDVNNSLKSLMWRCVGIERDAKHLQGAEEMIDYWYSYVMDKEFSTPTGWELQNMLTVSKLITQAALQREETRGVHHRIDFPVVDNTNWAQHITFLKNETLLGVSQPAQ